MLELERCTVQNGASERPWLNPSEFISYCTKLTRFLQSVLEAGACVVVSGGGPVVACAAAPPESVRA